MPPKTVAASSAAIAPVRKMAEPVRRSWRVSRCMRFKVQGNKGRSGFPSGMTNQKAEAEAKAKAEAKGKRQKRIPFGNDKPKGRSRSKGRGKSKSKGKGRGKR